MFKFLMKLISTRQMKFGVGEISLFGQYINIMPSAYFVGLTKYFFQRSKTEPHALEELYLIGWYTAYEYMSAFEEAYKVKSFIDRYRLGMDVVEMAGFGDYKTIKMEEGALSYVYTIGNPIAKMFKPASRPVDLVLCGITAGGGMIVHRNLVHCVEEECAAVTGKDKCILLSASLKKMDELGKMDLLKDQLDLDFLIPRQKEIIKNFDKYKKGEKEPWEVLLT